MTIDINELRRLAQAALAGPDGTSLNWIKLLQDFQQKVSPAAVSELLDRLEAAEKAVTEAYRRGYETGQEEIEKERDAVAQQLVQSEIGKREISEAHNAVTGRLSDLADENTALRAKVNEMERQEPIGEIVAFGEFLHEPSWKRGKLPHLGTKLYAIPGAQTQGEEK